MHIKMNKETANAALIAIDCELDEYQSMGADEPELLIRYGLMMQAKGQILLALNERKNKWTAKPYQAVLRLLRLA